MRLKANHYDTFFAGDAISSIAEARLHEPDLIILDLGLPAGDGFVVMERLKRLPNLAVIPVIVVSARDVRANKARSIELGAKAFLQNPPMMPNYWRSSGESSENPRSPRDLSCMTWDPYKREAFLSAPDHTEGCHLIYRENKNPFRKRVRQGVRSWRLPYSHAGMRGIGHLDTRMPTPDGARRE